MNSDYGLATARERDLGRKRRRERKKEETSGERRGNEIGQIRIRIQGAFWVSPPPATAQDLRIRVRSPAECRTCRGVREQIIDAVSHGAVLANKAPKLCGARAEYARKRDIYLGNIYDKTLKDGGTRRAKSDEDLYEIKLKVTVKSFVCAQTIQFKTRIRIRN